MYSDDHSGGDGSQWLWWFIMMVMMMITSNSFLHCFIMSIVTSFPFFFSSSSSSSFSFLGKDWLVSSLFTLRCKSWYYGIAYYSMPGPIVLSLQYITDCSKYHLKAKILRKTAALNTATLNIFSTHFLTLQKNK